MKVCFETFGCRLNKAEALQREADFLAQGWEVTASHAEADLIVLRGCSVTQGAQHDCEKLIAHLRRKYPAKPLQIEGCIEKKTHSPVSAIPPVATAVPTRTARAYLKVQDGCSCQCTFCIVPHFRGPSVSVPFATVLDRARRFIDSGYHELVVTGCNLALYVDGGKRLPELLAALAELSPDCRIRLGSLEPGALALATVDVMADHSNLCRFLHLPIQSASNRVLIGMRRPYFVRDIQTLVETAVRKLPNLGLGCDLMTGFPGETELDHAATVGMLRRLPFSNAHVFPYSERPGTPACAFAHAIPRDLRSHRAHELAAIAREKRAKFARQFLGQTVEIIVEHHQRLQGWTGEYLACSAHGTAPRKSRARIFVTQARDGRLVGRLCS